MREVGFGELDGFVGATFGEAVDMEMCVDLAGDEVVHGWIQG